MPEIKQPYTYDPPASFQPASQPPVLSLQRAMRPEDVGVSSKALHELMLDFEKSNQEIHSFMLVRHGKVAYEAYRYPYGADIPHAVNSFSKSVTSTAAGFAIEEGLFALDSLIYDFFPEYKLKKQVLKYKNVLTIRHILTMTTGKNIDVTRDKEKIDWVDDFLNAPFGYEPGTHFHYTNENAYMVCALIKKLTGLTVREYLKPRLFDPLGIAVPYWETDKSGVEAGGWGLYLKTEDGAKIMQCYLDGGKFQGNQIIPEQWTKEATVPQASNQYNYKRDSKVGYGYQFWMCHIPNTYAGRGMFGQQGVAMKDYDAAFFYTASHPDEQLPMDVLFRHFPEAFADDAQPDDESFLKLTEFTEKLTLPEPPVSKRASLEKKLADYAVKFPKQRFLNLTGMPTSLLPLQITYVSKGKWANISDFRLRFSDDGLTVRWAERGVYNEIPVGLDGNYRFGKIALDPFDFTAVSHGYWESENRFVLNTVFLESVASRTFTFVFKPFGHVKILQSSTPSAKGITDNIALLAEQFISNGFLYFFAKILLKLAPYVLQPNLKAKLVKAQK
ncbi:MAG: beta-lactamase family protein [Clostridiaceae bacterium]|jgi:CubicO group peptidase (beta-lactamase class C family)|nr:beta-lactamase family protein [Clostridiaceae bacterium]